MQNRIVLGLVALFVCFGLLAAVVSAQPLLAASSAQSAQSTSAARALVLVNSYNFEDVIGGAVFAAEHGDDYLFILTPAQGGYVIDYLSAHHSPIYYFESSKPVVTGLDKQITGNHTGSAIPLTSPARGAGLSSYFADNSPGASAIIVGREDGAEAVSVSSYAVLEKSGLYFSDASSIHTLIAGLASQNKSILVYGSLASSLSASDLSGVQTINTRSRIADNLEIVKMYMAQSPSKQMVFASGQTFEKTMAMGGSPLALIGLTEVTPDLISYVKENGIHTGKVIYGDGDTAGAQAMLASAGVTLFPLIGEGYVGDAQTRPLLVLPLPGPRPVLVIDGSSAPVRYDPANSAFMVGAINQDHFPAYLRIVVQLPNGDSGSSAQAALASGESRSIPIDLDAGQYAAAGRISSATIFVYYGSSPQSVEYIQQLDYSNIPVSGPSSPADNSAPSAASSMAPLFLAILLFVAIWLFVKPAFDGKDGGKKRKPSAKSGRGANPGGAAAAARTAKSRRARAGRAGRN